MSEINNTVKKEMVVGVGEIVVNHKCSRHSIAIESASANTFAIKAKIRGLNTLLSFADNEVSENSIATFILPSAESFEITPSDLTKSYNVVVSSF